MRHIVFLFVLVLPAAARAELKAFLESADVQKITAASIPPNVAATLWRPAVERSWWTTSPATLVSDPEGRSPFLLGSPSALEGVDQRYITKVPDEGWRLFYYDTSVGLGAGLARLPACWNASAPSRCIRRVVVWIGSGDNRARSVVSAEDARGFQAPDTLFVAFDMKALSLGLDVPGSPGSELIRKGLTHVLGTLGLERNSLRGVYLTGFSAGGAAALHALFAVAKDFDGVAALAPILLPWDIYDDAAPEWAKVYALATSKPERYEQYFDKTITPLLKTMFTAEEYRKTNAFSKIVRGDAFEPPLLVVAGADDDLGAASIASLFAMTHGWRAKTVPVVFGPADLAAGKTISFAAFPKSGKNRMAVVLLRETNHVPVPAGWSMDMRQIALDFFLALER